MQCKQFCGNASGVCGHFPWSNYYDAPNASQAYLNAKFAQHDVDAHTQARRTPELCLHGKVCWHLRASSDGRFPTASAQAKELMDHLEDVLSNKPIQVSGALLPRPRANSRGFKSAGWACLHARVPFSTLCA